MLSTGMSLTVLPTDSQSQNPVTFNFYAPAAGAYYLFRVVAPVTAGFSGPISAANFVWRFSSPTTGVTASTIDGAGPATSFPMLAQGLVPVKNQIHWLDLYVIVTVAASGSVSQPVTLTFEPDYTTFRSEWLVTTSAYPAVTLFNNYSIPNSSLPYPVMNSLTRISNATAVNTAYDLGALFNISWYSQTANSPDLACANTLSLFLQSKSAIVNPGATPFPMADWVNTTPPNLYNPQPVNYNGINAAGTAGAMMTNRFTNANWAPTANAPASAPYLHGSALGSTVYAPTPIPNNAIGLTFEGIAGMQFTFTCTANFTSGYASTLSNKGFVLGVGGSNGGTWSNTTPYFPTTSFGTTQTTTLVCSAVFTCTNATSGLVVMTIGGDTTWNTIPYNGLYVNWFNVNVSRTA